MKLRKLGKTGKKSASDESSGGYADLESDYAVTDPSKFAALARAAKAGSARAPEVWVKENEAVVLRFRDDEPFASFERYRIKNNGRWMNFVKPPPHKPDLFRTNGQRAQRVFVYEVIDRNGYTDKQGKQRRNLTRYYVATTKQFALLMELLNEYGSLTKMDIKVKRVGKGTDTQYTFMPLSPAPLEPELKALPRLSAEWQKHYAPPSTEDQKAIAMTMGSQDGKD